MHELYHNIKGKKIHRVILGDNILRKAVGPFDGKFSICEKVSAVV